MVNRPFGFLRLPTSKELLVGVGVRPLKSCVDLFQSDFANGAERTTLPMH